MGSAPESETQGLRRRSLGYAIHFEGIDNGSMATVRKSIEMKDSQQFAMAYKGLLADCYSCHKAAARPYLRPMIPVSGAQPILNLDPAAAWPE